MLITKFKIFILYIIGAVSFASSVLVIRAKNTVHSVLFLILVFINITALLLILKVEFLAILFLLIYVGAVAILFLFVVMMLDIPLITASYKDENYKDEFEYFPLFLIILTIFFFISIYMFKDVFAYNYFYIKERLEYPDISPYFGKKLTFEDAHYYIPNTKLIGIALYTYYGIYVLLAGIILLIPLIAAVVLTMHSEPRVINKELKHKQLSRDFEKAIIKLKIK